MSSVTLILRILKRYKWLVGVNLVGLAVALAGAIVIGLYVLTELSYDSWLPNARNLHVVTMTWHLPGREPVKAGGVPNPLRRFVDENVPEVAETARLLRRDVVLRWGDDRQRRVERVAFVDPEFFDLFHLPVLAGDPRKALADPRSLVVTARFARLLADRDPLGETVQLTVAGRRHVYRIGAVIADFPANSHLGDALFARFNETDFLASEPNTMTSWANAGPILYLLLAEKANTAALARRLGQAVTERIQEQFGRDLGISVEFAIIPLAQLHFVAQEYRGLSRRPAGDRGLLAVLGVIAIVVLLLATANYVSLATAMARGRIGEIALKRLFGASSAQLIRGNLAESAITAAAAGGLAAIVVFVALPVVSDLVGVDLTAATGWGRRFVLVMIAMPVMTAVIGGLFPGLVMMRLHPATLLRSAASVRWGGRGRVRAVFVAVQVAAAVGLIATTTVVIEQARHLRAANLGYDPEGLLVVWGLGGRTATRNRQAILERMRALPGVTGVGLSWSAPGASGGQKTEVVQRMGAGEAVETSVETVDTGFGFFATLGVTAVAGRLLSPDFSGDDLARVVDPHEPVNILVNRTAARALGFRDPSQALGVVLNLKREGNPLKIVGVVPDLRLGSDLKAPVAPTIYLNDPSGFMMATVRYRGLAPAAAMKAVEKVWKSMLPGVSFSAYHVPARLRALTAGERAEANILGLFALLAIAIAAVGVYGLAAEAARQALHEMALRRLFGATVRGLLGRILARQLLLVATGALVGGAMAVIFNMRWLAQYANRIAHDPLPYLLACSVVAAVAVLAVVPEAMRAARVRPARILRAE